MRSWLGLDIGTSSLKALLVADDGTVLARASSAYGQDASGSTSTGEQDAESWATAARAAIEACVAQAGTPDGIGLAGQVPTLVVVDEDGSPLRPAMTWQDNRPVAEAAELERLLGPSAPHIGMELPWSASHLPAKLLWLSRHEPELRDRAAALLQPKDFLGHRLTGTFATDAWSSKGMLDVRSGSPAMSVLDACGWSADACPPASAPWSSRGVTVEGALGLPGGIPVSVGWSDALASMLAVGALAEPTAFVLTGTSEIVGASLPSDGADVPGLYRIPLECAPRAVLYGPTQSSGATLQWLSELFDLPADELLAIAETARAGGCPSFVPYISGERAPLWQPDVRAVFAGVSAEHGRPEFIRSVLEGISLSAAHILELASSAAGLGIGEVQIAGRGAGDLAWKRVRLRTLGVPVRFHTEPFTSALGAAMLGAAAAAGGELSAADRLRPAPIHVDPTAADADYAASALSRYKAASSLAQSWRNP